MRLRSRCAPLASLIALATGLALGACTESEAPPAGAGAPGASALEPGQPAQPALDLPTDLAGSWRAARTERDGIHERIQAGDLEAAREHAARLAIYAGMINLYMYTTELTGDARDRVEKIVREIASRSDLLRGAADLEEGSTHLARLDKLMQILERSFPRGALAPG